MQMDEMTERVGQALQELRSRHIDSSYGAGNQPMVSTQEDQLPQEIKDFIQHRRQERARQKSISTGVYG